MPTFADAPPRVLSPGQVIDWLAQVADDVDITPISNRAAIKLAGDFALGLPVLEVTNEKMATVLGVSLNTAARALQQLSAGGHLAAERRAGCRTAFRPVLRGES
jgi:hypothetical protein